MVNPATQYEVAEGDHFALDAFFPRQTLCDVQWPFEPDAAVGGFEIEIGHGESVWQLGVSRIVHGTLRDQLGVILNIIRHW